MSSLKLLSWNMRGRDLNWKWLVEEADFDIAFLQEATFPTGFESHFASIIHHPKKKLAWGTAIVSRTVKLEAFNNLKFGYWGFKMNGSLAVAHTVGDDPIWLASMHCGHKLIAGREFIRNPIDSLLCDGKSPVKELTVIKYLLAQRLADQRFIVGGDLNVSILHDENRGGKLNQKILDTFTEQGFFDVRKKFFDEERQSFFKKGFKASQLDHLFADASLFASATNWQVLTEVVTDLQLSDHAPILSEFSS